MRDPMYSYRMQRFVNGVAVETKRLVNYKPEALSTAKALVNSLGGRKAMLSTVQVQRKRFGMGSDWEPVATFVQNSRGRAARV